ncbi:erythromycin esterase family protein [Actinoplanes sp. NPDC049265]|uniref:erythromycin esterase family protein n=1 Tax=Actinoplanes sp. NPDC049265 TaxID=3363902 RepID=UPI00370FE701
MDIGISRRPRILGLGEPTHQEDVLLELRNDVFRRLVEQDGYRVLAIESDCLLATAVDDYVTQGTGTLDEALERGFSHGWGGDSAPNRALLTWMRDVNADRPAGERLRFAGADGPLEITGPESPRAALTWINEYLGRPCGAERLEALLGDDQRWTNPATMFDPTASVGQSADARELRLLADDLVARLEMDTPGLIAATSRDEWDRARLYARTAQGLLRYHHGMADSSPLRVDRLLGVRDSMMAANILAAAEWGRTLVFMHNSHLQRTKSSMRLNFDLRPRWWCAGALLDARVGDDYAFVATAVGTIRHHEVGTPPPDTIEGMLYARPGDRFPADPREVAAQNPVARTSEWFGYAPLDPAELAAIDGLVFVRDCTGS